jgi:acyl-CoA synthetase (AMP-forming)/AMP-acid ligase II
LLCNVQSIAAGLGLTRPLRFGGWIPLYHDMGLMGHLLPGLCLGGGCVLMSADAFLRKPLRWLQLIARYGIELSASPNFGYERCLQQPADAAIGELDLSRWKYACNGSEPIKPDTLRAFAARFADTGFRAESFFPCYGMAEATLFVSGRSGRAPVVRVIDAAKREAHEFQPVAHDAPGQEMASSGPPCGVDLRVVDPRTRQALPEGRIGEIWLRGGGIAQGYWRNEAATRDIFRARCTNGEGPFLRTGDLGSCFSGELFVTGRIKELIIVKGRNLYPQDIEQELRDQHEELATLAGAVFSIPGKGQEDIIVCHEIRRASWSVERLKAMAVAMRATVTREFGVNPVGVLLLPSHSVLRTTSGKVRRGSMRDLFLARALAPLYQHLDRSLAT